jgi:heptosyltransferase-2
MPSISSLYVRLPNWVGDVCMSLPSLATLSAAGLRLVVCARPWAEELLAGLPAHEFIPMQGRLWQDRAAVNAHVRAHAAPGQAAPRGLLLPDSLSSAAVFRLAGVRSAGYRDDGRSLLLRWPIDKPRGAMHAVRAWHNLTRTALQAWQLPAGSAEPAAVSLLPLTSAHEIAAARTMAAAHLQERRFVLIAPTATGLHKGRIKVWPHFDGLVRRLQDEGWTVVMCPPPKEVEQARQNAPTAQVLPPLPLGALAALARQAALVICNDSGVSHLAAAAGARQLTLFGVTSPDRTGPWSPRAVCLGRENHWPDLDAAAQRARACLADAR